MAAGTRICPKCHEIYEGERTSCPSDGRPLLFVQDPDVDLVGKRIDNYTLLAPIGRGGMGAVYRALQHSMEREVAVKVLARAISEDSKAVKRFLVESLQASRLSHPNVVTLFDFGQAPNGTLYLAMELLDGRTLREVLASEGPLLPRRAVALVRQLCNALQAAHAAGVVHRDVKPGNVFVVAGAAGFGELVKLLDFGLAKVEDVDGPASVTSTGQVCGTPLYMSPEQACGKDVDGRSDVYSVGVVLYECLAGTPPFVGATSTELMLSHLHRTPAPLRSVAPGVSEALEAAVMAALEKDPAARPQSPADLGARLGRAIGDDSEALLARADTHTSDDVVEPPAPRPRVVRRIAAGLLAAVAGALTIVLATRDDPAAQVAADRPAPAVVARARPPARETELGEPRGRRAAEARVSLSATVRIDSVPAGATVRLDGRTPSPTPFTMQRPTTVLRGEVQLAGFRRQPIEVSPASPPILTVSLDRKAPAHLGSSLPEPVK